MGVSTAIETDASGGTEEDKETLSEMITNFGKGAAWEILTVGGIGSDGKENRKAVIADILKKRDEMEERSEETYHQICQQARTGYL